MFNNNTIDLLNELVLDASLRFDQFEPRNKGDNEFELSVERRVVENVKRNKILCFHRTIYTGMQSVLKFESVMKICTAPTVGKFNSENDFISGIKYDAASNIINVETIMNGSICEILVAPDFQISIQDIEESEYGRGTAYGKLGYTSDEWRMHIQERFK